MQRASLLTLVLAIGSAAAQTAPPRARPVEDTAPRAVPVAEPAARPRVVPDPPVAKARPTGPDEDLFDYASLAFGQKDYVIAGQSFDKYLKSYPGARHTADALFRLGECYRLSGQSKDGAVFYRQVVDDFPKTTAAANASYWLGVLSYNNNDHKAAATYFNFCAGHADTPAVKLAASFYESESWAALGEPKKQLKALEPVLAAKDGNPMREKAVISAAKLYQTEKQNEKALPLLEELLATAGDPAVKGNAGLQAAIIHSELKQSDEAVKLYRDVLKNTIMPTEQRGAALVGLISEHYSQKNYDGVIDDYSRHSTLLPPPDLRPRMLMHVANAERMKKGYTAASRVYAMIEETYGSHELAFEAGYWRNYCLYLAEDKSLVDVATSFLQHYASKHKDHEFVNTTRLLIADHWFNRQNYPLAAEAYALLTVSKIPDRFRASTLFHKGWCEAETGRSTEAITTLTQFIADNGSHPDLSKALAKRGLAYKATQNNKSALEDFARILKDFDKSPEVEIALYLSGLIEVEQRNWAAVITALESLVAKFPNSGAVADASYRTGLAYIEQRDTKKAQQPFRKAMQADDKAFGKTASEKLQLCLWNEKDVEGLAKEIDAYRAQHKDATLPPAMLTWLGITLFDQKDFVRATKYFTWASTPETPDNTDPRVWNYLGQSLLETKSYDESIKALDHYLATVGDTKARARALLVKAKALTGNNKVEGAMSVAAEGLGIVKDGPLQAELLIAQGNALLALGDRLETDGNHAGAQEKWKEAAAKFIVPSELLDDPFITPLALTRAADAFERLGDQVKAKEALDQRKKQYPNFKEPE